MQLNMASDYAVRALLYLAYVGRMAPASEVSEKVGIPKQYLVTMSRKLKNARLIDAAPGAAGGYYLARPAGGYYLARPAGEIAVLDIIRVTEGSMKFSRCTDYGKACVGCHEEKCPVRSLYEELQESVENLLGGVTLADLRDRLCSSGRNYFEGAAD